MIHEYQEEHHLDDEGLEDIIFGVSKHKGFWSHISESFVIDNNY